MYVSWRFILSLIVVCMFVSYSYSYVCEILVISFLYHFIINVKLTM